MKARIWWAGAVVWGSAIATVFGAGGSPKWTAESGPAEVALLELYTSEGCSSCPPAERWLGELRTDAVLWRDFVPVAWHVTYWDRLGWTDRWADRAHTARQEAYAAAWNARSIYTPEFVRAGREWRMRDGVPSSRGDSPGMLRAELGADDELVVTFAPGGKQLGWTAHVALLGGGIVSEVRAGENRGRELRHEFVALDMETVDLSSAESGRWSGVMALPAWPEAKLTRRALAVWVSRRGEVAPVQATGGWVDAN